MDRKCVKQIFRSFPFLSDWPRRGEPRNKEIAKNLKVSLQGDWRKEQNAKSRKKKKEEKNPWERLHWYSMAAIELQVFGWVKMEKQPEWENSSEPNPGFRPTVELANPLKKYGYILYHSAIRPLLRLPLPSLFPFFTSTFHSNFLLFRLYSLLSQRESRNEQRDKAWRKIWSNLLRRTTSKRRVCQETNSLRNWSPLFTETFSRNLVEIRD